MRTHCPHCQTLQSTKGSRGPWKHLVNRHTAPCGRPCVGGKWALELQAAAEKGIQLHETDCEPCAQARLTAKLSPVQKKALRLLLRRKGTENFRVSETCYFTKQTARALEKAGLIEAKVLEHPLSYDRFWFLTPEGERVAQACLAEPLPTTP
jgi:DNA-binding MarR family transcriptional regulator